MLKAGGKPNWKVSCGKEASMCFKGAKDCEQVAIIQGDRPLLV
jgi:hypothetical protein